MPSYFTFLSRIFLGSNIFCYVFQCRTMYVQPRYFTDNTHIIDVLLFLVFHDCLCYPSRRNFSMYLLLWYITASWVRHTYRRKKTLSFLDSICSTEHETLLIHPSVWIVLNMTNHLSFACPRQSISGLYTTATLSIPISFVDEHSRDHECTYDTMWYHPIHVHLWWFRMLTHFSLSKSAFPLQEAQHHQKWLMMDFIQSLNGLCFFAFAALHNVVLIFFEKWHTSNWWRISQYFSLNILFNCLCLSVVRDAIITPTSNSKSKTFRNE